MIEDDDNWEKKLFKIIQGITKWIIPFHF
jgi:hypothetical protein